MMVSIKKHAIALSDKEFAIMEAIHELGPCCSDQVQEKLEDPDLLEVMRLLHDLVHRNLLERPVVQGNLLYSVKPQYKVQRSRMIVMAY
jgi:predicted transcriptional regulator